MAFRNCSDNDESDEFHTVLLALCEFARDDQCVIMCAEVV